MSQPLPLNDQLKALEHLQELDLQIDVIKKKRDSLPAQLKALDEKLGKALAAAENKKNVLAEIEKVQRQTQAALDLNNDRLGRSSAKLEGVQNSHEFQAASKEIEQIKKLNLTLEEQLKKNKNDSEAIQKELNELSEKSGEIQTERDAQATAVSAQNTQFENEIVSLEGNRTQFVSQVEARILARYERVRAARGGVGIVPAIAGRCKGCNMMVPPQLYNEIHRNTEMHSCPSCNRILFSENLRGTGDRWPSASADGLEESPGSIKQGTG